MVDRIAHCLPARTLVLGGARSGKSRYAEGLVTAGAPPWIYLATAQPHDEEMAARIAEHRARRGAGWTLVEAPLELAAAIAAHGSGTPLLVDCLTLWLSNLMFAEADLDAATGALISAATASPAAVLMVSNEVGMGIVPENALARRFRDEAGRLNRRVADQAERVIVMFAGQALALKGA